MKKVSRRDLIVLAIVLIGFSIFAVPRIIFHSKLGVKNTASQQYYCPMHPTYTSNRPGDCPICNMKLIQKEGSPAKKEHKILYYRHPMRQPDTSPVPKKDSMGMDYIPVYEDELVETSSSVAGHAAVHLSMEKQQLIGVKLGSVTKQVIKKEIRTTGRVAFDPELYTAQQEFISAAGSFQKAKGGPYHEPLKRTEELLNATKTRLRLLGMSEEEITGLEANAVRDSNLILPNAGTNTSAQSKAEQFVWVYGAIYEYELPFVQIGSRVKVRIPTVSGREFTGEVRALDPVLDASTRSIRLRARVENPEGILRPEMYVDVYLESDLGETLAVPEEAVMQTGERTIVFVVKGEGIFEPREVGIGTKAGKFYEIKSGVQLGEQVVVSGNFLIDSESRLQAALQGMASGGEHVHG